MYLPSHSQLFSRLISIWKSIKPEFLIISHTKPDGDAIGSQMGLCRTLRSLGFHANYYQPNPLPYYLAPFTIDTPPIQLSKLPKEKPLYAIYVDCANLERAPTVPEINLKVHLNIDHHTDNPEFAEHNIVLPSAAATTELLACLLLDNSIVPDPIAAQALYLGIVTDTGQFQNSSTTERSFELAQKLVKYGADPSSAANILYSNNPLCKYKLLALFLATFQLEENGLVCIGKIKRSMLESAQCTTSHTEGLVEYTRAVEGVIIGISLEETIHGGTKGSLRAIDPRLRVDLLAKKLKGGGHKAAAGFVVEESIEALYPKLLHLIKEHIEQYKI